MEDYRSFTLACFAYEKKGKIIFLGQLDRDRKDILDEVFMDNMDKYKNGRAGKITIATSIVPRNIEHQQSAIASWQALGFNVISINSPSEIIAVEQNFPSVTFVAANRTAENLTGKPYIYFDDVLKALAESRADICGIVNSDIHLMKRLDLQEFIGREARGCFLFGSRIDIEQREDRDGEIYFLGFDFFFFDRSIIDCYPTSDLCLGAPWWDYWAVAVPLLKKLPCKELITPIAFHLKHETKWAYELYSDFGKNMAESLAALSSSYELNEKLASGISEAIVNNDPDIFNSVVLRYIVEKTEKIIFDSQLSIGIQEFETMRLELINKIMNCKLLSKENDQLKASLCACEDDRAARLTVIHDQGHKLGELEADRNNLRHQLQAIEIELSARIQQIESLKSSLSWRITAPLRAMLDLIRRAKG